MNTQHNFIFKKIPKEVLDYANTFYSDEFENIESVWQYLSDYLYIFRLGGVCIDIHHFWQRLRSKKKMSKNTKGKIFEIIKGMILIYKILALCGIVPHSYWILLISFLINKDKYSNWLKRASKAVKRCWNYLFPSRTEK